MRPQQIAKKNSESAHQQAFFAWCNTAHQWGIGVAIEWLTGPDLPSLPTEPAFYPLKWIHHIPNGGSRGDTELSRQIRGGQLKAEGVKEGALDVFWPYPVKLSHGLYIEFKDPKLKPKGNGKGGLKPDQIEFGNFVFENGYQVGVAYSWIDGINILLSYLGFDSLTFE